MKHIRLFEILLYAAIFLVALCSPFFIGDFTINSWGEIRNNFIRILPFIVIFLINNYLLVPRLLFAEKYRYYFLSCFLSVIVVVYLYGFLFDMMLSSARPPFEAPYRTLPPEAGAFRRENIPPPNFPPPFFPGRRPLYLTFGLTIVSFLLIGFNTGVRLFVRWSEEREQQADKERQYLAAELASLKHQISPHFFMNTLNNVHALIDIDADKAKDAIVRLSRLMRYLLYEADVQKVSLKKEIEFIESYIELMRLRYDENILTVETEYPAVSEDIAVPSLLFLSFVENAFKYGVFLNVPSLIRIRFVHENGRLTFTVQNNKSDDVFAISETSGIGLDNVQKRLDLIFKDDYQLEIISKDDTYSLYLNIPV